MDENDKQLLDNIRGNPDDPLPKGIYADWLEEQGRADYATFIRLSLEGELDDEQSALLRTVYERSLSLDRDGDDGQKARENAWFHGTGLTGTTRFEGNKISLHISPSPSSDRTFINPFVLADRFEEVARLVKAPCFYFSSVSISVGFLEGAFSVGYISPYDVRGIVRAYADNVDM